MRVAITTAMFDHVDLLTALIDLRCLRHAANCLAWTANECLTVAAALLREAADLLLGANRRWSGSGKWLLREIEAFDDDQGTGHAAALIQGLRAAANGNTTGMRQAVLDILTSCGGVLFDGFRRDAPQ